MTLTIRTDKPEAEVGLYLNDAQVQYKKWQAHRQLSETIHLTIEELLNKSDKNFSGLQGIIFYQGPGSFTGLRIGASVANALSVGLGIPLVQSGNNDWIKIGLQELANGKFQIAIPDYGGEVHITKPKK